MFGGWPAASAPLLRQTLRSHTRATSRDPDERHGPPGKATPSLAWQVVSFPTPLRAPIRVDLHCELLVVE
jgi:hypothetical protein